MNKQIARKNKKSNTLKKGTIILILFGIVRSTTYKIKPIPFKLSTNLQCSVATTKTLLTLKLKHLDTSIPISFNLLSNYDTVSPDREYIQNLDINSLWQYGMFQLGTRCLAHDKATEDNSVLFLMLVIGKEDNSQDCKVERIITNTRFVRCNSLANTKPLWEILTFSGTSSPNHNSFTRVDVDPNYLYNRFTPHTYNIENLAAADVSENLVEMGLMQAFYLTENQIPARTFSYEATQSINQNLAHNSFAYEILPSKLFERYTKQDLPGYYLGVYSGSGDDTHKFLQKFDNLPQNTPSSMHLVMYMSDPTALALGQTHKIDIKVKALKSQTTTAVLSEYKYKIQLTREAAKIKLELLRETVGVVSTINYAYTGQNEFIYFAVTVGKAALYHNNHDSVKVKCHETLVVFMSGGNIQVFSSDYTEDTTMDKIIVKDLTQSSSRMTKVEYMPPSGITSNQPGFRVDVLTYGTGVYHPDMISSRDISIAYPGCFISGYHINSCLGMAHLTDPTQAQTLKVIQDNGLAHTIAAGDRLEIMCKVPLNGVNCLIPKQDYIVNLEQKLTSRFFNRIDSLANYNAMPQSDKNFFYEFTNAVGTKYLISCPYACNSNFSFVYVESLARWDL